MELKLDMLTVCRTCLQDGEAHMVPIFENEGEKDKEGFSLGEKIESFSGIQINCAEDLPKRICLKCKAFLILALKFRQICQRSDEFLRDYVIRDAIQEDIVEVTASSQQKPPATEQYDQLEVEVLDGEVWATEELIEETVPPAPVLAHTSNSPPSSKEIALVLAVETVSSPATGKLYVCEVCGNGYPRKSTLDTHMRRHNNDRPFECEICHKRFHVNYQLVRHIRQHTGAKPYTCQYCQRNFADRTSLVKHERTHRNERPYTCQTCGKTFTYASVLKVHYKTHTGEKPHICQLCGKSFARNHNLVAHLQTQQHLNDPRTPAYLNTLKVGNIATIK
ncbi:hypothetical protein KR009_006080 [Drosophila setifemur]|nr:hypothetical protein KR009_006080 [Drosophila setifemur]